MQPDHRPVDRPPRLLGGPLLGGPLLGGPLTASRRPLALGAALAGAALVLAGCTSGGEPEQQSTVTVTAPATPSEDPASGTSGADDEQGAQIEQVSSDVVGRAHDAGAVVDHRESDGRTVLELDRWTVVGLDDGDLARDGVDVVAHDEDRFTNQNDTSTYDVPVSADVMVVLNECVAPASEGAPPGLTSTQSDLETLLARGDLASTPLLLTYDDAGDAVQIDTDARC